MSVSVQRGLFQSTLLHEERRFCSAAITQAKNFNPRSYMRSDPKTAYENEARLKISIHAPT